MIAVAILSLACCASQAGDNAGTVKPDRAPRFADHAMARISNDRVKPPRVPKHWGEDPRLRVLDTVGSYSRANFAGRYFVAVWSCGSACVSGAVIEPRTGEMHPLGSVSGWNEVHDKFEGIDFRHNSRLIVLSGQRNEKPGDMGRHFYVFENGKLKFLKTIETDGNFMTPVE